MPQWSLNQCLGFDNINSLITETFIRPQDILSDKDQSFGTTRFSTISILSRLAKKNLFVFILFLSEMWAD